MTIQADCSIGFKKETPFGTGVTVDRFLEFTSESLDRDATYSQGQGLRPGSRLARSGRRALTRDGAKGDIELEVPSRGLGTFLELLLGTASSTVALREPEIVRMRPSANASVTMVSPGL